MKNKTITAILAVAAALLMTVSCKKEKSESPIFQNYWIMEENSYVGIFKFNSNNTMFVGELIGQSYIDQMKSKIQKDPDCYRDSQKELIGKLKENDWAGVEGELSVTEESDVSGILVFEPGSNDEETFKYSIADGKLTLTSQLGDGRDLPSIVLTSASAKGIKLGKMYPAEEFKAPDYLREHLWLSETLGDAYGYGYIRILSSGTIQKGLVVSEHMVNSLSTSIILSPEKYSDTAKEVIRRLAVYDLLYETNYEAAIYPGAGGDGEYNTSGLISIPTLDITNEKYKVNDKSLKIFKGETIAYEFESAASLGIEPGEEYLMSAIQPISE